MGINRSAIASYLISLYCSLVVQSRDALAVLEAAEIGSSMTIPTATSDFAPAAAGLRDVGLLTALANQLFAAYREPRHRLRQAGRLPIRCRTPNLAPLALLRGC